MILYDLGEKPKDLDFMTSQATRVLQFDSLPLFLGTSSTERATFGRVGLSVGTMQIILTACGQFK